MRIEMVDLTRQYKALEEDIRETYVRVATSGQYIGGEEVRLFEIELASYLGGGEVVSVGNGTDALEIAYLALGLVAGDEVIIPTHNYVAAAEVAVRLGLVPVWADTSEIGETGQGFNICADESYLEGLLSPRTRALVGVNLYGFPVEANRLRNFCKSHGLFFIEDNAQGMGGSLQTAQGRVKLGLLGDIATTSFFPTKPLGAMGDGGAIITSNPIWAERARMLANHGQHGKYRYHLVGKNSRLDSLQAALLRLKLTHLDHWVSQQQQLAQRYYEAFSSCGIICPLPSPNQSPTYHQYTLVLPEQFDREEVRTQLIKRGISSQLYYPEVLHQTGLYASLGIVRSSLQRSEILSRHMLSLPIHPFLRDEEQEYIIQTLYTILHE